MKTPHKHADLIKAWADGAEIEFCLYTNEWRPCGAIPYWYEGMQYRIKPEPNPDVVENRCVARGDIDGIHLANLKLTWDGETGKLKAAEVLV